MPKKRIHVNQRSLTEAKLRLQHGLLPCSMAGFIVLKCMWIAHGLVSNELQCHAYAELNSYKD